MAVHTLTQIVALHLFWSISLSQKNYPIGMTQIYKTLL